MYGGIVAGVAFWTVSAAAAILLGALATVAPLPALAIPCVLIFAFARGLRTKALLALLVALLTISHTVAAMTVAAIPLCSLAVAGLSFMFRAEIAAAMRNLPALRLVTGIWAVWLAWTIVRLFIDYPVYGVVAIRDAAPVLDFGAIPLGAAIAIAYSSESRTKALKGLLVAAAAYTLLLPLFVAGQLSALPFLAFDNASTVALTVYGAGLWAKSARVRMLCITVGLGVLFIAQVRMSYITAAALTGIYLLASRHTSGRTGRTGAIVCLVGAALVLVLTLPAMPFLTGRVGAVTVQTMTTQLAQVANPGGDDAGSVGDRNRWWGLIAHDMNSDRSSVAFGLGLGRDLLHGYRSRDSVLVRKPHNDVIEWFAREGVIGLFGVVTMLGSAVALSWRRMRADPNEAPLFAWAFAGTLSALGEPYLSYSFGVIPLALIIGYSIAMNRSSITRTASRRSAELTRARADPPSDDRTAVPVCH